MPCPFFFPLQRAEMLNGIEPARAPLHAIHQGLCRASDEERVPTLEVLEQYCNFGYGKRGCEWFPATADADAVRFSYRGGEVVYIVERDCFPIRHGSINTADSVIRRQAEVFIQQCPVKPRVE